jgi:hypothetical protein
LQCRPPYVVSFELIAARQPGILARPRDIPATIALHTLRNLRSVVSSNLL